MSNVDADADQRKTARLCVARSQGLCRTARANTEPEQTQPHADDATANCRPRLTNEADKTPTVPKSLLERSHRRHRAAEADQVCEPTGTETPTPDRSGHNNQRRNEPRG